MIDFLMISTKVSKKGSVEIYPKFRIDKRNDLMTRGGDFYAIWLEDQGLWSTNELDAIHLIDEELDKYAEKHISEYGANNTKVLHMWDAETGMIDNWHKYCQRQLRDQFHPLDERLIFSNQKTKKRDYASKTLPYPLEEGSIEAYSTLIDVLYSPEERQKLEWAIGAVVSGDSVNIQKFLVLYGAAGTGKSTVLNIIQMLFDGYYSVFDAKALGSSNDSFALEAFKTNPLVAIQHDGDLSRIEDNTRLNSLVSHEMMTVNEKFKSAYSTRFNSFLFMGTNKPVRITDAKSGIIRRLIDVSPTGEKVSLKEYRQLMKQIAFELGAIAFHCKEVYEEDPNRYETYVPLSMLGATNDFYNFIADADSYFTFDRDDYTTLTAAYNMYKSYCEEANAFVLSRRIFGEELKNYFENFYERYTLEDGTRVRSFYKGFIRDKFLEYKSTEKDIPKEEPFEIPGWLDFKVQPSIFDEEYADSLAQYANESEAPNYKWENVRTKLKDLNTKKLHYVMVPVIHIVVDFDIHDENGNKCLQKNIEAASRWPKTYAELSKSGQGIHLHYIYTGGDPTQLSRLYADNVEIKVFTGKSSLRRKLTKCNNRPIATISSGLPIKEDKRKMVDQTVIMNDKGLRTFIQKNLRKEYHPATKPSIDFIFDQLEKQYASGKPYDVTNLQADITAFAASSTHQADYCLKLVSKMHFKSDDPAPPVDSDTDAFVFYDIEVFPNLLLINYKKAGKEQPMVRLINPKPIDIEKMLKYKLIGFNNRRYDNHILWACLIGYSIEQIYELSQRIVSGDKNAFFGEAYNISYTDIYDFSSKKQSLKKWEIELGVPHMELGMRWDEPVDPSKWNQVSEYCDNDVYSTEALFNKLQGDFAARKIQVEIVKRLHNITNVTVNDTTNTLSGKIIFGNNKNPQTEFNYRNLALPVPYTEYSSYREKFGSDYIFRVFDKDGNPTYKTYDGKSKLPDGYSILPFFPGYKYDAGKSTYLGQEIGEGGRVYSEPGMYTNVWDGDITSQHPHSMKAEVIFGPRYTKVLSELIDARVAIKHRDFEKASKYLNGALAPFLNESDADQLSQALKIVINSIYGLTSASFKNLFNDQRNKDNIVAKRGALFMTKLKEQVELRGFKVAHIKTDSIKIPNATEEIKNFVIAFGKEYGYSFETEADFERFCLVNDAVYVAKYKEPVKGAWWTATGKQFQVPYVFKTLFSHEPIVFEDMCETMSVNTALYLDMNENLKEGEHDYKFIGKVGQFTPVVDGVGGGLLVREGKDKNGNTKYDSATGAKGYRWMESQMVKNLNLESKIDRSYYERQVKDAIADISKFGDFYQFVSDNKETPRKDVELELIQAAAIPW